MGLVKSCSIVLLAMPLVMLSGCATITTGTTQDISLDTGEVKGADCQGVDNKQRTFHWKATPCSAKVRKGDGPMVITCTKEGLKTETVTVDETIEGNAYGNILLGGIIGAGVDAMSGAGQHYPNSITVPMDPKPIASQSDATQTLGAVTTVPDKSKLTATD